MQKEFLKYLISESKKFVKKHEIFDIVLYGSSVKGKLEPNDMDILVIFENFSIKERTDLTQELKNILKKCGKPDIKSINLSELFSKDFLARQGLLIEGYSLVHEKKFAELLGFRGFAIFNYNLKKMNKNEKTKFIYALIGRRKETGILKKIEAIPLGKGVVKVPVENSIMFQEFLEKWKIDYTQKDILETI